MILVCSIINWSMNLRYIPVNCMIFLCKTTFNGGYTQTNADYTDVSNTSATTFKA